MWVSSQCDAGRDDACDVLEVIAWRRANASSDLLLIFLLKAHRPEKYRETIRQEHTGAAGVPLRVDHTVEMTDTKRLELVVKYLVEQGVLGSPEVKGQADS